MAIQQPTGDSSPLAVVKESKENLTGFERASQEIEKASQLKPPQPERESLAELQPNAAATGMQSTMPVRPFCRLAVF